MWSHGIFNVKYETLLYSPVSCSQINEFIASDSFARSYDRPILVSGNMTGEAKLESNTELLRDIHNQYVTCEDLGPQKLMIKASFPRKIGSR